MTDDQTTTDKPKAVPRDCHAGFYRMGWEHHALGKPRPIYSHGACRGWDDRAKAEAANNAPDDATTEAGWWVPVTHFWRQTLLPKSGSMQKVRTVRGKEHTALVLHGYDGWRDGNYQLIRGNVTDWFKPAKWFRDRADLVGRVEEASATRARALTGSILRGERDDHV